MFFGSDLTDDDVISAYSDVKVVVDPSSANLLTGSTLDFKDRVWDRLAAVPPESWRRDTLDGCFMNFDYGRACVPRSARCLTTSSSPACRSGPPFLIDTPSRHLASSPASCTFAGRSGPAWLTSTVVPKMLER